MSRKKFLFLFFIIGAAGFFWHKYQSKIRKFFSPRKIIVIRKAAPERIACYIGGEVKNPGVYYLPPSARLEDLLEKAGGLTKKADRDKISPALRLFDRQSVYIPKRPFIGFGRAPEKTYFDKPVEVVEEN